jgi:pimeloyl-ACP methyl ester carboxylesterase
LLVKAITRKLGEPKRLLSFSWTGRNSHFARAEAALSLAETLRRLDREYQGTPIFLVAHSHGGNVALYALQNPEVESLVRGIIFLGTPFLSCRPTNLAPFIYLLQIVPWVCFLALTTTLVKLTVPSNSSQKYVYWQPLTGALLAFALWSLTKGVIKNLPGWQTQFIRRLSVPTLAQVPMLVLHTDRDEAFMHLRFQRFLSWASVWGSQTVFSVRIWILGILLLLFALRNWSDIFGTDRSVEWLILASVSALLGSFMMASAFAYALTFVLVFLNWCVQSITVATPFGFGGYSIGFDLLVGMDIDRTYASHLADNRCYRFKSYGWRRLLPRYWWHGMFYQDERCIGDISEWMSAQMNRKVESSDLSDKPLASSSRRKRAKPVSGRVSGKKS